MKKIKILLGIISSVFLFGCSEYQHHSSTQESQLVQRNPDSVLAEKLKNTNNKKINGIYLPELINNFKKDSDLSPDLILLNNTYYILISDLDNNFSLINLENGKPTLSGNKDKYNEIIRSSIKISNLNSSYDAIFITNSANCPKYGKKYDNYNCKNSITYDFDYPMANSSAHSFFTHETSYISKKNRPLSIGFFSFAKTENKLGLPNYSKPESIVVNNKTTISYIDKRELKYINLPNDILSHIFFAWRLDENERYLVWFGSEHPFLFMVLDLNRGLNIPENKLRNIYFIPYEKLYARIGKHRNPLSRAEELSKLINSY